MLTHPGTWLFLANDLQWLDHTFRERHNDQPLNHIVPYCTAREFPLCSREPQVKNGVVRRVEDSQTNDGTVLLDFLKGYCFG